MEITEVQVMLPQGPPNKVLAYVTVVFDDCFLIRDIKIIDHDPPFLAMPYRSIASRCPRCSGKNWISNAYCGSCGIKTSFTVPLTQSGKPRLFGDVCHPITPEFRKSLTDAVMDVYESECVREERMADEDRVI